MRDQNLKGNSMITKIGSKVAAHFDSANAKNLYISNIERNWIKYEWYSYLINFDTIQARNSIIKNN